MMVGTRVVAIWPLLITVADTTLAGTRVLPTEVRLAKVSSTLTSVWSNGEVGLAELGLSDTLVNDPDNILAVDRI
jgi:hypothetical protein